MPTEQERLAEVQQQVLRSPRYRHIDSGLVERIARQELAKGRSVKEAVKETRGKLHQVGGAYQETTPDYGAFLAELRNLPGSLADLRPFCLDAMGAHASTRERLPTLQDFYAPLQRRLGEVTSILDLACGLNPLALPWMPLAAGGTYVACDIYADMMDFLRAFMGHCGIRGQAGICDLTAEVPSTRVDLVLLLKTLPCLEQIDKKIGARLLAGLNSRHALISYPARSLGGREKGMALHYSDQFERLIEGQPWQLVERWQVPTELAFLITRKA